MFHKCKNSDDAKVLYRRLAKILHPDVGGIADLMVLMQESYEIALSKIKLDLEVEKEYFQGFAYRRPQEEEKPVAKNKYPGKYQDVEDFVDEDDDERVALFFEMFAYAKEHKRFDPRFISSVFETLDVDGSISPGSYNACVKIYYAFFMHTWFEKHEASGCQKSG